jgi:Zn-dependent protease with chaperone function
MAIVYSEHKFLSFNEYISRRLGSGMFTESGQPAYAHPVDGWIIKALNVVSVKSVLNKAADVLVSVNFGFELSNGVLIDQKTFPEIFDVLFKASKTLAIPVPHAVAVSGQSFNAYTAGTDEYAFICIASEILKFFSTEEAMFVIGHECGHIAAGHMLYHTVGNAIVNGVLRGNVILKALSGIPLAAWSKCSEITADRAGLICCGDINTAIRALIHVVTGFADESMVDIDDFIRKFKKIEEYHKVSRVYQLFTTHPMIPKRIEALMLFAESEVYYEILGMPCPIGKELIKKEELDRRVSKIMKL